MSDDEALDAARQAIIAAEAVLDEIRSRVTSKRAMVELDDCTSLCEAILAHIGRCRIALCAA